MDVHISFYHSDITVISENREDCIVDSEKVEWDPEWFHIAVAVTIEGAVKLADS